MSDAATVNEVRSVLIPLNTGRLLLPNVVVAEVMNYQRPEDRDDTPNWFLGIEPNAFGAVGAIFNFAVALVVSRVTKAPPEHIQHLVEDIRVPAGAKEAVAH